MPAILYVNYKARRKPCNTEPEPVTDGLVLQRADTRCLLVDSEVVVE